MRLLVSTSQWLGIVSLPSQKVEILHEGSGVYTGVTWDKDRVYAVATDNKGDWDPAILKRDPDPRLLKRETILVIEKSKVVGRLIPETLDTHEILYWNSLLYVTNTSYDQVVAFDPETNERLGAWQAPPDGIPIRRGVADRHHLNSFWADDDEYLWVLANNGDWSSAVYKLRKNKGPADFSMEGIHRDIGEQCHGLCVKKGVIITLSSRDSTLRVVGSNPSATKLHAGFPRGMTVNGRSIIIGGSARGSRDRRHFGDAEIIVLRRGTIQNRFWLKGAGQIYQVRAIDAVDTAHHGSRGPACPLAS